MGRYTAYITAITPQITASAEARTVTSSLYASRTCSRRGTSSSSDAWNSPAANARRVSARNWPSETSTKRASRSPSRSMSPTRGPRAPRASGARVGAQRAGAVVKGGALAGAEVLGHRDLHVVDGAAPPQRLDQRIGEAQGHQVLHRFLAQVVVDAEDARLVEAAADFVVDGERRREIAADRFLQHDPRAAVDQAGPREVACSRAVQ